MTEQKSASTANIDDVIDTLLQSADDDVARIPERDFRQFLLPLFVNKEIKDFSGWLKIAGSWARPIDVTDDRDSSKVLFRVPALVGTARPPMRQNGNNSTYNLLRDAERKAQVVPRAGHELLKRGLSTRVHADGDRAIAIEQWNTIFRRYGFDDLVIPTSTATQTNPTATQSDSNLNDNVDGYDDL